MTSSLSSSSPRSCSISFEANGTAYRGELFLPEAPEGSIPLVVVIHEWWGLTEHPRSRARRLAEELGVVALAVDLYGDGRTAESPSEAQTLAAPFFKNAEKGIDLLRQWIRTALEFAKKNGYAIDSSKTYAIGFCFGGTQALNLARSGETLPAGGRLAGVASFHGGLTSPLGFKKGSATEVLVLNGGADPMVTAQDITALKANAASAGIHLRFVDYPGALHAFTNTRASDLGRRFGMPIAYDAAADQASWSELSNLIRHGLPKN